MPSEYGIHNHQGMQLKLHLADTTAMEPKLGIKHRAVPWVSAQADEAKKAENRQRHINKGGR